MNAPTGFLAPRASRLPASWLALQDALTARWRALGRRERNWITLAAVLIGGFVVWSLAIQPAWRTLRSAPAQIDQLDAQTRTMQKLAAEAADLRNAAPVSAAQTRVAFQTATERLGTRAKTVLQGDFATVTVTGLSGDELRSWLAEVRSAARARATEVQLARDATGYTGTVVLSLGAGGSP